MSNILGAIKVEYLEIEPISGGKGKDLTENTVSINYYEDILEPAVSMTIDIMSSYNIVSELPIRGGEKVTCEFSLPSGKFIMDGENAMYVYKVGNVNTERQSEIFTLYLTTRENFSNETARCFKKYKDSQSISEHVKNILKDNLHTTKFDEKNIETTRNSYSFYGSARKPFNVIQWLAPKSVPVSVSKSGDSGEDGTKFGEAKGTGGYLFYQNRNGFNFKSVESLVSNTSVGSDTGYKAKYITKGFGAIEAGSSENVFQIIHYSLDKNIDVRKSLRVGMYSNMTVSINMASHEVSYYKYDLPKELGATLGGDGMDTPSEMFGSYPSRQIMRTTDHGVTNLKNPSSRDASDMAKSFSRYNLLFTQSLNILVPCNIKLMAGDIVHCELPSLEAGKGKDIDTKRSGNYLIKEVCHHFSKNQNTTSLKLIRDSYGVYGT